MFGPNKAIIALYKKINKIKKKNNTNKIISGKVSKEAQVPTGTQFITVINLSPNHVFKKRT